MTVVPETLRFLAAPRENRAFDVCRFTTSAATDAAAIAILLADPGGSRAVAVLAATVLHATAALLALGPPGGRASRRWLALAAAFSVPLAGAAVGIAAIVTAGRGRIVPRPRRMLRRRAARALAEARRVRETLTLWDALTGGDDEHRRAALSALARRDDAEAIALLRWTTATPDPDLAMSAALALDEISERMERRVPARNVRGASRVAG